jgi:ABC-type microcin C transport system permease subunit YejB
MPTLSSTGPGLQFRCDIQRATSTDPFGGDQTWQTIVTNVRCLWWVTSGREQIDESRSVTLADENIMFQHGVDVQPGDRIVELVDAYGRMVFGEDGFREIEHVTFGRQHLSASLRSST